MNYLFRNHSYDEIEGQRSERASQEREEKLIKDYYDNPYDDEDDYDEDFNNFDD